MTRGAVVGSSVAHVAAITFRLVGRTPASVIVPGPEVVQVSLLDPGPVPTTPPVAPPPPPEPTPTPVAPVEEEGVKIKPEKPKPRKAETRPPEPKPSGPSQALPSASLGPSGLKGDLALDATNFEFTYYLLLVRNKIAGNWSPPTGLAGGSPVRAVVYFRIGRDGQLSDIRLETGSNAEFFDRSAVRAVTLSDPLPPLPLGFAGSQLGVHFGFDWETP